MGNESFIIGNIKSGIVKSKQEDYFKLTIFDRAPCNSCWVRFICGGDCYHNSYLANSNCKTPDVLFCSITKYIVEQAIFHINDLQKNNATVFNRTVKILKARDKLYGK